MATQAQTAAPAAQVAAKAAPAADLAKFATAAVTAVLNGDKTQETAAAACEEAISRAKSDRAAAWHKAVVGFVASLQGCPQVTEEVWRQGFAAPVLERFKRQNEKTAAVRTSQLRLMVMAATHGMTPAPFNADEGRGDSLAQFHKRSHSFLVEKGVLQPALSKEPKGPKLSKGAAEYLGELGADGDERAAMFEQFGSDEDRLLNFVAFAQECGRGPDFARVMFKVVSTQLPKFIQHVGELANLDTPPAKKVSRPRK